MKWVPHVFPYFSIGFPIVVRIVSLVLVEICQDARRSLYNIKRKGGYIAERPISSDCRPVVYYSQEAYNNVVGPLI